MENDNVLLEKWMSENNINAPELAKRIGVEKQSVYFQLKKSVISDSFKHKLSKIGADIFHLSTLNEPEEQYQVTIHEPKKGDTEIMERLLKSKDEMIEQLRSQLRDKDKIISLYEKQNPEQLATAQGKVKAV